MKISKRKGYIVGDGEIITKKGHNRYIVNYKNYKTIMEITFISEPVGMDMNGYPYTTASRQVVVIFDRDKNKFVGGIGKEVEIIKEVEIYNPEDMEFEREVFGIK